MKKSTIQPMKMLVPLIFITTIRVDSNLFEPKMLGRIVGKILCMLRSAVNVTGDASNTTFVAKSENCLNLKSYNRIKTNE
ncbi:hypothetical protein OAO18_05140 [Francisellaceae bacterium]|nr:hypothetical protein [Francisellaceae bacterium]